MKSSETPRPWYKRGWVWIAISVCVIAALSFAGYKFYKRWQPERLAKKARVYFDQGDVKNAALTIRNALLINPNSVAACRIMAEINEKVGHPDAIMWRHRVVDLAPGSFKDSIAWAASALRFGQTATAAGALETVRKEERNKPEYHATAGAIAVTAGKVKEADFHFGEALKLEPENEMFQYNRATLQLQSADPNEIAAARTTLEKLTASAKLHTFAERILVMNFMASNDLPRAQEYSGRLQAEPEAPFSDRILHLNVLFRSLAGGFADYLAQLQERALANPDDTGALITWLTANGMREDAIAWSKQFPDELIASGPVGSALAPSYVEIKDWQGLQDLVTKGDWGTKNYLRHAFFARALREQGDKTGSRAQWTSALAAASKRPDSLQLLGQLLSSWKWNDEFIDLLWAMATEKIEPGWALLNLHNYYRSADDTLGLHRVASRMVEIDPNNEAAKNNYAMFSLLLKSNTERALAVAWELYAKHYNQPLIVSTYALALHTQGRSDEALEIMNTLSLDQLAEPTTAAYYGMLLKATGAPELAATYLDRATKAKLLPEEKRLVFGGG